MRATDLAIRNGATLTSVAAVSTHIASEYGNDVSAIVDTVSDWDVHYARLTRASAALDLELVADKEGVRRHYESNRAAALVIDSYQFAIVSGSWYSFRESVGILEPKGAQQPTGRRLYVPTAAILPAWSDGIIGEIIWERFPAERLVDENLVPPVEPEAPRPYLPGHRERNRLLHDRVIVAWRDGQADALADLIDDTCCSVIRTAAVDGPERQLDVLRSKKEHRQHYASNPGFSPTDIRLLNIVVGDWYVFAEYLLNIELVTGATERDMVVLYPLTENGRLVGQLAYALDRRNADKD